MTALGVKGKNLRRELQRRLLFQLAQIRDMHLRRINRAAGLGAISRANANIVHKGIGDERKSDGIVTVVHVTVVVDPRWADNICVEGK